jgi:Tannase and feruloyl esterase
MTLSDFNSRMRGFAAAAMSILFLAPLVFAPSPARGDTPAPSAAAPATRAVVTPTRGCADLANVDLTDLGGAGSRVVKTSEAISNGVTVCSVEGTLAPTIGFRLDLPTRSWTQRFLQVGCGGLCGRISLDVGAADGCAPLEAGGFVIASTDMGHQGPSGEFGRDPQKREDFAHRAVHLTAVASKALIRAFYGRSETHAYFTGCSDGGREALIEAQRYPDDFDGIIAGAPAMNFQVQNGLYHAWQARSNTGPDSKPIVTASRLPLLHEAVLEQCDGLDGQVDRLISEPRLCRFDPGRLLCHDARTEGGPGCLSAMEVEAVRRFYDGPRDPTTGRRLTVGGPQPGSELAWAGVFVPSPGRPNFSEIIALDTLRNLSFETNPAADFHLADVRFDLAGFDRLRPLHPLYDATNPDLSAFASSGGKLILWHGWADQHISPLNTIAYHEALERQMGRDRADGFERLYLLPGMYHCRGGEGPNRFDLLTPMIDWVEKGVAPEAVTANQTSQGQAAGSAFGAPTAPTRRPDAAPAQDAGSVAPQTVAQSRPVYPYPSIAVYDGQGDPNLASSYGRGAALVSDGTPDWAGADFYHPYVPRLR